MSCETIVGVPIGAHCNIAFVFKNARDEPIDLLNAAFVLWLKGPSLLLKFDTTTTPSVLYVEEDASIVPLNASGYIADQLILALTPVESRQIPLGALTRWEIERRDGTDQHNYGSGLFRGCGGLNPDV